MVLDDTLLLARVQEVANSKFDGHMTILKFTSNWRVGFVTPTAREEVSALAVGKTFAEAASNALSCICDGEGDDA